MNDDQTSRTAATARQERQEPPGKPLEEDPWGWVAANQAYLDTALLRLRLLLRRRIRWLRATQWSMPDPLAEFQAQVISDAQTDRLLTGEDRAGERQFWREDEEAAALTQGIAEAETILDAEHEALAAVGFPPALETLCRLFGLNHFERDLLVLCLAPEVDPAFERLYAYVQDDANRRFPTLHLALALFPPDEEAEDENGEPPARCGLLPEAALRRFDMVLVEAGATPATPLGARPLRLDERIADYLLGFNHHDERIAHLMRLPPAPPDAAPPLLPPAHRDLADRLHHWVTKGSGPGDAWPAINLVGPPGAGKTTLARALCERLGLQLAVLDPAALPPAASPERRDTLRLLERESVLLHFGFYLDAAARLEGAATAEGATSSPPQLTDLVDDLKALVIVGGREPWRQAGQRPLVAVRVPRPDAVAQRALWEQALSGTGVAAASVLRNGRLDALVQQFDLGPSAIARTCAAARTRAELRAANGGGSRRRRPDPVTADDLWQGCREQARGPLDELAQRIAPCHDWDDLILPPDVAAQLREVASQVAHRAQVYEAWGFGTKLSRGRGLSALFAGPSGTGKTLAAEVLAGRLQLDLYRIDLSSLVSKYIGETEKNLRRVFDAAEQSGAILFFDEADALFGKRSEVKDSHDRYANIEVSYLLQRMESYRGLAVLATNMKEALDQAFLRRLRFLVDFPFPTADLREQMWRRVFPSQADVEGLDYALLSRLEIPGGNIKNIALNAAFLAADRDQPIRMAHLFHAARREYAKIDKILLESEFGSYYASVAAATTLPAATPSTRRR